jgi:DNA invertase Pin-like site-specific DNA recombinase
VSSSGPNSPAGAASLARETDTVRKSSKERQLAGTAKAKTEGKSWGGRKPGTRISVTEEKEELVRRLVSEGKKIAVIARMVGLSRKTIYKVLRVA